MRKFLLLLSLLIPFVYPSLVFGVDLNFKFYKVEDGLSSNTILDIIQDSDGHIWVATENGLNKFNGYEFQSFRSIPRDTSSIINNYVYSLFEDSKKRLWVGTERGVCIYDLKTNAFRRFNGRTKDGVAINDRIQKMYEDEDGNIYICALRQGVFAIDAKGRVKRHSFAQEKINPSDPVWVSSMYKDREGVLWASVNNTQYIIYKFDKSKDKFIPAFPNINKETLAKMSSHAMLEDTFGTLWLGSWSNGLYAMDKKSGIKGIYLNSGDARKIVHIHSITEYEPGKLLIGSNDGLTSFRVSPNIGNKMDAHFEEPFISNRFVYPIYKDNEGGLWIGTYYGGINYASPNRNYFTSYVHNKYENSISGNVVSCFCEDKQGNIWIGTDDGGLNCFNVKTEKVESFKAQKGGNSLSYHNIHALCIDDNNLLWIGTYTGGLNVLNLNSRQFKHYYNSDSDLRSLYSNSIYAIYKDSHNNVWVATTSGINLYNRSEDNFVRMKEYDELTVDILEVGSRLWFATIGNGIYTYNLQSKVWKNYTFENNNPHSLISNDVTALCLDDKNQLWVGTNSGLCKYDSKTDQFINIPIDLPSNAISNIFSDNGYLWITTTKGLVQYDPTFKKVSLYTNNDGLLSDQFNLKSGIKASSGRIYIGTAIGFNAFYPKQIELNKHIPQVAISEFQLFYKRANMADYIDEDSESKILQLPYNQNSFSFEYTALSYFAPEKNEYAFFLEGFDSDWNYVGQVRKATYTNIPPGDYIFRVRASNNDGVWNETGIAIPIHISSPLWWNSWSVLLYVILLIAILFILLRSWRNREDKKNQEEIERIKTEQEKEASHSKINFFTSIAHEIRTPVSLIKGPLEQIMKNTDAFPEKIVTELNTIDRNSQRLLILVNQLLDFRKIEKETVNVSLTNENIYLFLLSIYERFQSFVENKNIKFVFSCDDENFRTGIDTENLTKVISNLLSNASKYSTDYIMLKLDTQSSDDYFKISVIDNGPGISEEEQENIFKLFYQIKDRHVSGTGIGLYLVKSIVDALNGKIDITKAEPKGLNITISLPTVECPHEAIDEKPNLTDDRLILDESIDLEEMAVNRNKHTILIVEDNVDMQTFLYRNLDQHYDILLADNGKRGLEILSTKEVDVILSDIMMPEMDGIEFCNNVKNSQLWNHIPIIMLTAKTNISSKIEALDIGADAYLEKPFSLSHLIAQIKNLIESRKKLLQKFADTPFAPLKNIASNDSDQEFLAKLNEIIEQNISNERFSIDQLAGELNISNSGLFAKIKNLTSITPKRLLLLVRLKKASELLIENKYRINEICYMVGFNNPSYFAKCFQKQYGVLPKEFRDKALSE